jgi:pimeloyl-ACP methyl ester carboxylesterase
MPVVIIEPGLGGSINEWAAVVHKLSSNSRVYTYERAGYGHSDASSFNPMIKSRCDELTALLEVTGVKPPWVLVGQSYGGNLVREFLVRHGSLKVKGLVIVDCGIERTPLPPDWPTLLGDSTYQDVVGLEKHRVLSDKEWKLVFQDDAKNGATQAL